MSDEDSDKPQGVKRTTTQRLRMAAGHMQKVVEMSEKNEKSLDVLQQLSAVISALKSCSILLVLDHVNGTIIPEVPDKAKELLRDLEHVLERSLR